MFIKKQVLAIISGLKVSRVNGIGGTLFGTVCLHRSADPYVPLSRAFLSIPAILIPRPISACTFVKYVINLSTVFTQCSVWGQDSLGFGDSLLMVFLWAGFHTCAVQNCAVLTNGLSCERTCSCGQAAGIGIIYKKTYVWIAVKVSCSVW